MTDLLRVAPLARAGKRAAVPLVAALYLCACGDSGTVPTPPPPPAPTPIGAPNVTNQLPDLELTVRGPLVVVDFSQAISGVVSEWSATSSNTNVAVVSVGEGGRAEVAPVSAGAAQITVTARNAGGVAETTFAVRVVPQGVTAPPTVAGALQPVTLSVGGGSVPVDLATAFSPPGFTLTVRSLNPGIVTASVSGTTAILRPVSPGSGAIEITAHNAGGSLTRTLLVTVVARPAATGNLEPLALVAGSTPTVIDLSTAFSPPTGLSFQATSDDDEVATAAVVGRTLTVTPLAPGTTAIVVTAQSAAGSATRSIRVVVVGENQATAPTPVGTLPPLMLGTGSGAAFVDVGAAFAPRGFRLEARSLNPGVATVSTHSDTALRVTPAGAGTTTIEVTASNSFGSGSRRLQVEVVGPPRASRTIRPVSLTIGAPPEVVDLRNAFSPTGFQVTARSLNEGVVAVSVGEGPSLSLTPVAAGNTSVEVTARNAGGSTRRTIRVTVAAAAPRAVGTFAPVSLSVGGAAVDVDVAHAFIPAGVPVEARSRNPGVVAATLNRSVVTLTPVGPGNASVDVTARNASGSATLSISVNVTAAAPQAVGTVAPVSLSTGGAAVDVDVAAAFTPAGVPIEARSLNTGVVNATVNGSVVTLTPVGPGNASVEVTARNASGSANLSITVVVAAAAPPAPVAVGTLAPAPLAVGGVAVEVDVAAAFTPAGVPIAARSLNTGVVNATVNGSVVTLTPVGPGNASVEVTARNASGSANLSITVVVAAAAPTAPVAVGTLAPIYLSVGGTAVDVDVAAAFTPAGVPIEVRSLNTGFVNATVNGSVVTLAPVGSGNTSVEVTARNASGSATLSIAVGVAAAAPPAPVAVGTLAPISLTVGGVAVEVDVAAAFTPAGVPIEARSVNSRVVTATVNGSVVTLTPVGDGSTSVEVTARNASGSATLSIAVGVAAAAPPAPVAVGTLAPISLTVGGVAVEVDVAAAFTPAGVPIEARSVNSRVVTATVNGSVVTLTPVGDGSTSVEVTARNASGSANLSISVAVAANAPPAPVAVGTLAPVPLAVGGVAVEVDVAAAFTPAGVPIEARSLNTGVVNATVNGSVVTLTPVGDGSTSVEVTARNASGSATLSIAVTVAADSTAPRVRGGYSTIHFAVGGAARRLDVQRLFVPAGLPLEARSLDTGVVTVAVNGSVVTLTPVGPGAASVEVTATNASGSATMTIRVTVAAAAPEAVGTPDPLSLPAGGAAVEIDLADLFTPTAVSYSYISRNPGIVSAGVRGSILTLTPASAGTTSVRVDATNALGSATQTISVTVTGTEAPRAVGTLAPVSLTVGGEPAEVDVADAFTPAGFTVRVSTGRETVATVAVNGTVITITPVGEGTTRVYVDVSNASGTARQRISVTVAADPTATVDLADVTLSVGGETLDVDVARAFPLTNYTVEASSRDTGIVTVEVNGTVVTLTPVGAGTTYVSVRARGETINSGKGFSVTVYPVAPQAVGTLEPVTLMDEGPAVEVDVADAFTPADVTISARYTGNTANIDVTVEGTVVTIGPRGAGNSAVQVTARNSAGSATQTFLVTVLPVPPEAVGTVDAVALVDGGASVQRNFWRAFEGWQRTLEARSNDTGIVTAVMDDDRWAVFTPVGVGSTTVVVTARNAGGSASHSVLVTVTAEAPEAIRTFGPTSIRFEVGRYLVAYIANIFTPATLRVEAVSNDTEVVTAQVTTDGPDRDPIVKITPVGLGTTTVEITGSTANGSASYTWEITVVAPG